MFDQGCCVLSQATDWLGGLLPERGIAENAVHGKGEDGLCCLRDRTIWSTPLAISTSVVNTPSARARPTNDRGQPALVNVSDRLLIRSISSSRSSSVIVSSLLVLKI